MKTVVPQGHQIPAPRARQHNPMMLDEQVRRIPSGVCVCLAERFLATSPHQAEQLLFSTFERSPYASAELMYSAGASAGDEEQGRAVARCVAAQIVQVLENEGVDESAASEAAIQMVTLLGDPDFTTPELTAGAEAFSGHGSGGGHGTTHVHLGRDGKLGVRRTVQWPVAADVPGQAVNTRVDPPTGGGGFEVIFWLEPVRRTRSRDVHGDSPVAQRYEWHVAIQDGSLGPPEADPRLAHECEAVSGEAMRHALTGFFERAGIPMVAGTPWLASAPAGGLPPHDGAVGQHRTLSLRSAVTRPCGGAGTDVSRLAAQLPSQVVISEAPAPGGPGPVVRALPPVRRRPTADGARLTATSRTVPQPPRGPNMGRRLVLLGARTAFVSMQALGTVAQLFGRIRNIGVFVTQFVAPAMFLAAISESFAVWRQTFVEAAAQRAREARLARLAPDVEQFTAAGARGATVATGPARPQSALAVAALEHQTLSAQAAARRAQPPADVSYVRDVYFQLVAAVTRAVNWAGATFGLFVSSALDVLGGLLGGVAGVLHAVQGVVELKRGTQALTMLSGFSLNVQRIRGALGAGWRQDLVALTRSVSDKEGVADVKLADILERIDDVRLRGVRKLAAVMGEKLSEHASRALDAEKVRVRNARLRIAFGIVSALMSGALTGLALAGVGGVVALSASGALLVFTAGWLIYGVMGLFRAYRETRDAQTHTPTAQDRDDMARWAGSDVNELERDLARAAAPSRYLVSALLAKYLTLPTKIGADEQPTDDALLMRMQGKTAKRLLLLAGCSKLEVKALCALARDEDPGKFAEAVTWIAPHIFGKVGLERHLAPFAGMATLRTAAALGAVTDTGSLSAGRAAPAAPIRAEPQSVASALTDSPVDEVAAADGHIGPNRIVWTVRILGDRGHDQNGNAVLPQRARAA